MKREMRFAENLKRFRESGGMTQEALAEKIGFSPRSVSKWERGNGLPTLVTLAELAELFGATIDELLYSGGTARYLAVDGGGTKTAFLLADGAGNVMQTLTLGPSNPNDVGMEQAQSVLRSGIRSLCGGACRELTVYAGIAGCRTGKNREAMQQFLSEFGFRQYECGSDIDNVTALDDKPQEIFVILGTGIAAFARRDDKLYRTAGWGQLFDGGGSGYDLGCDAIRAALRASDGTGAPTMLTELFRRELGEDAPAHLGKFYAGGKRYIAGFARLVFEACEAGDAVAEEILRRNVRCIAEILRAAAAHLTQRPAPVLFAGGLAGAQEKTIFPLLERKLGTEAFEWIQSAQPPVYGALKLAREEHAEC